MQAFAIVQGQPSVPIGHGGPTTQVPSTHSQLLSHAPWSLHVQLSVPGMHGITHTPSSALHSRPVSQVFCAVQGQPCDPTAQPLSLEPPLSSPAVVVVVLAAPLELVSADIVVALALVDDELVPSLPVVDAASSLSSPPQAATTSTPARTSRSIVMHRG